ncbi:MAG TPA: hypothetical protein VGL22_01510 [Terracidiphilus sp.]
MRITAAGVTPLDYTILSGNFHIPEVPLVLGNEGAGVVEGHCLSTSVRCDQTDRG